MKGLLLHIKFPIVILVLLLLSACVSEEYSGGGNDVPDEVRIELFTRANEYKTPVTRSGADEGVDKEEVFVLVFKKNDNTSNYDFVEAVKSFTINGGTKTYVILKSQTVECKLLILANPQAKFYVNTNTGYAFDEVNLTLQLEGKTLQDACNMLLTEPLAPMERTVPFTNPATKIPLSIVHTVISIDAGTKIGIENGELELTRPVAKLIVENTAENATLLGIVEVNNIPRQGLWYNLSNSITPTNFITYYQPSGSFIAESVMNSTEQNPLYIYESHAENTPGAPYMILKMTYKTTVDGNDYYNDYYYKMALVNTARAAVPLLRNHYYVYTITKVTSEGYITLEEARNAPAYNNTDVDIVLTVTNISVYETTAFDDYYLSLSNSMYFVFSNNSGPFHAFSFLAYKGKTGTVSGSYKFDNDNTELAASTPSTFAINNTTLQDVNININNLRVWESDPYGYDDFEIRLGNLKKKIQVRRETAIPAAGKTIKYYWPVSTWFEYSPYLLSGEVVSGEEWIQLLPASEVIRENTESLIVEDGKLHIKVLENTSGSERKGLLYLTTTRNPDWSPHQGYTNRIKVDITQLAN